MKSLANFKLSRRGFLQALGLATAVAVLPPVATKELIATSDPLPAVSGVHLIGTVDDSLLDAPINAEHPFGWISLNGERMKLHHMSLTISNQVFESPFSDWSRAPRHKPFGSEICRQIEFSTLGEYPSLFGIFASGVVANFAVDLPEYPNVFSGKGVIESMDYDGRFTRECSMNLVGDFQVRLDNSSSGWMI